MSLTEHVNQNEMPTEAISNQNDTVISQSITPEQSATKPLVIQQNSHEIDYEDESQISLKDIIVSSVIFLSFVALLVIVYIILPS